MILESRLRMQTVEPHHVKLLHNRLFTLDGAGLRKHRATAGGSELIHKFVLLHRYLYLWPMAYALRVHQFIGHLDSSCIQSPSMINACVFWNPQG